MILRFATSHCIKERSVYFSKRNQIKKKELTWDIDCDLIIIIKLFIITIKFAYITCIQNHKNLLLIMLYVVLWILIPLCTYYNNTQTVY